MYKNRRNFIGASAAGLFGLFPIVNSFDFGRISRSEITSLETSQVDPLYPTTNSEDVRKVVGAAHARFDLVQEIVNARPELAKATYAWGFSDWESALGAAAHMG